jgi:hypothetical protein
VCLFHLNGVRPVIVIYRETNLYGVTEKWLCCYRETVVVLLSAGEKELWCYKETVEALLGTAYGVTEKFVSVLTTNVDTVTTIRAPTKQQTADSRQQTVDTRQQIICKRQRSDHKN